MDLSNIVIYVIIAVIAMFILPKLGIRPGGRGRGNSPLNPPGNNPGGGGGGLFPGSGGGPATPAPKTRTKNDNDGDFADRVEGDKRPEKSV